MELVHKIEKALEAPFKDLPPLSKDMKQSLVNVWPWLAIVIAFMQLLVAKWLYDWTRVAEGLVDWANQMSAAVGGGAIVSNRLTFWVWVAIAVLVADAVILLIAFPKLQKKLKSGWDLLFLAGLLNVVYGLVNLFIPDRSAMGALVGTLIGSAIGFYLLFQVREYYGRKALKSKTASEK